VMPMLGRFDAALEVIETVCSARRSSADEAE